jgi:RNA polymerase sigma factor (sigma-70 family)
MNHQDFDFYYQLYFVKLRLVQRIARKLAREDDELAEDLIQEGLLKLSKLNPDKAKVNTDAWIRQSLKFAMVDYLRKNSPHRYESLDARLLDGDQLERDPVTGQLRLLTLRHQRAQPEQPVRASNMDDDDNEYA